LPYNAKWKGKKGGGIPGYIRPLHRGGSLPIFLKKRKGGRFSPGRRESVNIVPKKEVWNQLRDAEEGGGGEGGYRAVGGEKGTLGRVLSKLKRMSEGSSHAI